MNNYLNNSNFKTKYLSKLEADNFLNRCKADTNLIIDNKGNTSFIRRSINSKLYLIAEITNNNKEYNTVFQNHQAFKVNYDLSAIEAR